MSRVIPYSLFLEPKLFMMFSLSQPPGLTLRLEEHQDVVDANCVFMVSECILGICESGR